MSCRHPCLHSLLVCAADTSTSGRPAQRAMSAGLPSEARRHGTAASEKEGEGKGDRRAGEKKLRRPAPMERLRGDGPITCWNKGLHGCMSCEKRITDQLSSG